MTRCQHCDKLTHTEHMYVEFYENDMDKVYELRRLIDWDDKFIYQHMGIHPNEYGRLKCGDIYIHFIWKAKNDNS